MKFVVSGINCQNCVNLIKNSLEDSFGEISVNIEKGIVECDLPENLASKFANELNELDFEVKGILK